MSAKYRLLFVHPFIFARSGPDQCLYNLLQMLHQEAYELYLVIPERNPTATKYESLVEEMLVDPSAGYYHQLGYVHSNSRLFFNNLFAYAKIRRLLRSRAIDLVHTNAENAWIYGAAARSLGIPSLAHIHGLTTLGSALGEIWMPAILRACADHIIAVSQPVAEAFARAGYPAERITVIDNGVDTTRFQPADGKNKRSNLAQTDACTPVIGAVGSAEPRKGWANLILACNQLKLRYPQLRCVFTGSLEEDERYTADLKGLVEFHKLQNNVFFTGLLEEMPEVYAGLDVLVQPSLIEAGPRAPIEAMACGVPVVATRVGGNSDYVQDGVTGLLCAPGDPAALAGAIERMLLDGELRQRMSVEGRRAAVERFSLEAHVRKVEDLYEMLLGRAD